MPISVSFHNLFLLPFLKNSLFIVSIKLLSSIQKPPLSNFANLEFEPPFAKKLLSGRPETGRNQAIRHELGNHPIPPFFLIFLDFATQQDITAPYGQYIFVHS